MAQVFKFPDGTLGQYVQDAQGNVSMMPVQNAAPAPAPKAMNPLMTALVSAGNAATLGYLPQLGEALGGRKAADLQAQLEASQAANPISSLIGSGLGILLPGGIATKTLGAARGALGIGTGLKATAKALGTAAKATAAPALAGAALSGTFGARTPAPPQQLTPIDTPQLSGGNGGGSRSPDARDFWAARMGVRPEDVDAITQQYGGIPLTMMKGLNDTRASAPNYKNTLGEMLIDVMQADAGQAAQAGEQERQAWRQQFIRDILPVLGGSDLAALMSGQ